MWKENSIFYEDISNISKVDFIPWDKLNNKVVLITGATGLIGSALIKVLIYANELKHLDLKIIALVRDIKKAKDKFKNEINSGILFFVVGNVEEMPKIEENIDYIIHGASQTASKEFIQHAAETINTSILGTMNLLEFSKEKQVLGFILLSSMEVYGHPLKGHKVKEYETGALSPLDLRNSYPLSKQICESLCCAYASEYKLQTKIIRLTQTFGPGVDYNDTRIFAYFARCAIEKQDIVLKTRGETERSYLYILDTVTAILTVLLNGKSGQAYNAADEDTYCSIAEMAEKVAADGNIKVRYSIQDEESNGFLKTLYMDLDTTLLKNIGWKPLMGISLCEFYKRMIKEMKQSIKDKKNEIEKSTN